MVHRATCFGGLFVRDGDDRLVPVGGRRADALLARLIWDQGRPVPRAVLISLLWPDRRDTGANALRQAVHVLRNALGRAAIETAHGHVMLTSDAMQTDLGLLRDPAQARRVAAALSETITPGAFLAGLREAGPDHAAWLSDVRARADALAADALVASATEAMAHDQSSFASRLARAALGLAPSSEAALRLNVEVLIASGNILAAQQTIDRFQTRNGKVVPPLGVPDAHVTDAGDEISTTHSVIVLGLLLPEMSEADARKLAWEVEEAGAEEIRQRHGALSALIGRQGLRHSLVAGTLAWAHRLARAPTRLAVGLTLARIEATQGAAALRELDRARALIHADRAGPGAVGLDPALERLSGAEARRTTSTSVATRHFVGREAEQDLIRSLWAAMSTGGGTRILAISGPPGIGKSRLTGEATKALAPENMAVVPPAQTTADARDVLGRLLAKLDPHPQARRERPPSEHLRLILGVRDHPLLILLEDAETLAACATEALVALIESQPDMPVLWMLLVRSERPGQLALLGRLAGAVALTEIFLGPLSTREAGELAARFDISDPDRRVCLDRAGGNPLFLNQLLLHAENGVEADCPASVEEAVAARLAHLDTLALACLRLAAILGGEMPAAALRDLAAAGQDVIDRLVQRRMLRWAGDLLITDHDVIRSAIAAMTPKAEQRSIHLRAANYYRERDRERHAWHLLAAGDRGAAEALLIAAREACAAGRATQAATMAVAGRKAARRKSLQAALAIEEAVARVREGRLTDAECAFRTAMTLTLDREIRAEALIGLANVDRLRDDPAPGFVALLEAEPLLSSPEQRARHLIARGRLHYVSGAWQDSVEPNRLACQTARSVSAHALEAEALGGLADAEYAMGDMHGAEGHVRSAIQAARKARSVTNEPAQSALLAHIMIYDGRLDAGESLAERTIEAARAFHDWRAEINAQLAIASASFCRDDLASCEAAAKRVALLASRAGAERFTFVSGLYLARVSLAAGNLQAASAVLDTVAAMHDVRDGPIHAPQFTLLKALTSETTDGLATALAKAEAQLAQGSAAHNALRVLPVAALHWRWLNETVRQDRSLAALRRCAGTGRVEWARIMHDAIASDGPNGPGDAAARVSGIGFRRLAVALTSRTADRSDMLVC